MVGDEYGERVSRRVAAERRRLGWSQQELANLAGIGRQHVSLIENGRLQRVSVGTVARLALALDVTVDWLIGLTHKPRCACAKPRGCI